MTQSNFGPGMFGQPQPTAQVQPGLPVPPAPPAPQPQPTFGGPPAPTAQQAVGQPLPQIAPPAGPVQPGQQGGQQFAQQPGQPQPQYQPPPRARSRLGWLMALLALIGAAIVAAIMLGPGCNSAPPPPPGPSTPPSAYLTEPEAVGSSLCQTVLAGKQAVNWYMVFTSLEARQTYAARLCVGPGGRFQVADNAKIVGQSVYIREGGHDSVGTIDTKYKLSDAFAGKLYARVVGKDGSQFGFANPLLVYVESGNAFDDCSQYKGMTEPAADDMVAWQIWWRCNFGDRKGPKGDRGPAGPRGPKGDTGPQGSAAPSALPPIAPVDVDTNSP